MSEDLKAVLKSNTEFTKNMLTILARNPGNVFFSPVSIHAILSLAYQGARGPTQEAFSTTLNLPDAIAAAGGYEKLMSVLNSLKGCTLLMANKIFLKETFKLQKDFKNVAFRLFSSEIELEDFKQPERAAKSINSWVENKTNNKIHNIINKHDITDETRLILVNAIYFKGNWAVPFQMENTRLEKFYVNENDTIDVQMMHHYETEFWYKEDNELEAQVLRLLYVNYNIGLIVILPNERNGIKKLEERLQRTDLTKIMENMRSEEVNVSLPKFKIEETIDFKHPLTELGLGVIYDPQFADFTGIIENKTQNLHVSQIVQKAFIEVNEVGTEAAAATGYDLVDLCATVSLSPPKTFRADHPFYIMLYSTQYNARNILFAGRISTPQH